MVRIFDKHNPTKWSLERAMSTMLPSDANVVFASVENFDDVKTDLEAGIPVIFYGMDSEANLRLQKHPAAPWFYSKNAAYFKVPFSLINMVKMCEKIRKGEKIENPAVKLASRLGYRQTLVPRLLHDIWPGYLRCEESLKLAEEEFGIKGTIEEVREQLEKLRGNSVGLAKEVIGEELLPGIFCDVEGTLISDDRATVNADLVSILADEAKKRPVTLWTGGDIREAEKLLTKHGVKDYPLVSKDVFRGCQVETVYDDLSPDEFLHQYDIRAKTYIKV